MSSSISLRECCCNCHHQHNDDGINLDYHHKNEDRFQRNPYLIEWEEFLNKFASKRTSEESTDDASPDSPTYSEEEDDILSNEENERQFRMRMRQRQGYWNGLTGKNTFQKI